MPILKREPIERFLGKILCGDCREVLKRLPSESVDLVLYSPPYYGLRDYSSLAEAVWDGDASWR